MHANIPDDGLAVVADVGVPDVVADHENGKDEQNVISLMDDQWHTCAYSSDSSAHLYITRRPLSLACNCSMHTLQTLPSMFHFSCLL